MGCGLRFDFAIKDQALEWGQCSSFHKKRPNIAARASFHQLHQVLAPDIPLRLRRVESAFSAAEGIEFGGGLE
jgi:hypothetical protein